MATKRSRDVRDMVEAPQSEGEGIFNSFKRIINNFLFPSYGVVTASTPAPARAPPAAPPSPPTKRRRITSSAPEEEQTIRTEDQFRAEEAVRKKEEEEEEDLSRLSIVELKQRGYTAEDIHRIFEGGSPTLPRSTSSPSIYPSSFAVAGGSRYTASSFISPGSSSILNGSKTRRGATFAPPPPPPSRRTYAPVGTYTPSASIHTPRRLEGQRWSPAQDLISRQARASGTASLNASRVGATPRSAQVRATPSTARVRRAPSRDLETDESMVSSVKAHRILERLESMTSPLPNEKMTDARALQRILGKRHMDTASSRANGGLSTKQRPHPTKPLPVAKRQRVDEESYIASSKKGEPYDGFYRDDSEEQEAEEVIEHEAEELEEKITEEPLVARRERKDSHKPRHTPTEPSATVSAKPSAAPAISPAEQPEVAASFVAPAFVSPIASAESIFNYKPDFQSSTVPESKEEEKAQDLLPSKAEEKKESDTTTNGHIGFVLDVDREEKKEEPSASTSLSFSSSAPSLFSFGSTFSADTTSSTSGGLFDFKAPSKDESKDDSAAPKTDLGFVWGKEDTKKESTSTEPFKIDAFSSFNAPTTAATTSATDSVTSSTTFGFSIPPPAKVDGWKCACCETANSESDSTCSVCLVPRPVPKTAEPPKSEAALPAPEPSKPTEASTDIFAIKTSPSTETVSAAPVSFGFAPIEFKPKEEESTKTPSEVGTKEDKKKSKKRKDTAATSDLFNLGPSPFSASPFTLGSAPSLSTASDTSALSASSSTLQKPFVFGATETKDEQTIATKPEAAAAAPIFSFTGSALASASAPAKDEDSMADSSEPSGGAAVPATSFFAPSAGSTLGGNFPFSSASTGAALATPSAPSSSGMFMFGAQSSAPATSAAPAPSLTASGSGFPFGASSAVPTFPAAPASSSAFAAPSSSAFTAPSSSAFAGATTSATAFSPFGSSGGDSVFGSSSGSVFGAAPAPSAIPFGTSAAFSPFGAQPATTGAAPPAFGGSLTSSGAFATPFGQQAPAPSPFGQPAAPAAPFAFTGGAAPSPAPFAAAPAADAAGGGFTLGAAPSANAPGGRRMVRGRRRGGH